MKIKVWDLFVRLSHWLVVLLVLSAWLSSEIGDAEFKWHSWNGYALLVIVLSRVLWGFVGSTTARFSSFIKSPWYAIAYLRGLLKGKEAEYAGHNPAGGWMVLMIWLTLIAQAVTGLFSSDDIIFDAPFSFYVSSSAVKTITGIHHALFNLLVILVVFHVIAVIYHEVIKKEALVKAMLTGKKSVSKATASNLRLKFRPFYLALLLVGLVAGAFWLLLNRYS